MRLGVLVGVLQEALDLLGPDAQAFTEAGKVIDVVLDEDFNTVTLVGSPPEQAAEGRAEAS
jgi:hypothetical protein